MSRELIGEERDRVIRDHLEWCRARRVREAVERPADYPLAMWTQRHVSRLAADRTEAEGYYRNTKGLSRGRIPLIPRSK